MTFDLAQYKSETRQLTRKSGPIRFGLNVSLFEYFWFDVFRVLWRRFYFRRMSESADAPIPIMPTPSPFQQKHVENCRVFADRYELLKSLPKGKVWAEVGTFKGAFARKILDICQPSKLDVMDLTFDLVKKLGYVHESDTVTFYAGDSTSSLRRQADKKYDFIYIDAGHDLINVARDTEAAVRKLKDDGMIIFNDYIYFSHKEMRPYGIVPVVNSLAANGEWEVACFAFQNNMYCDIALRRAA